MKLSIIQSVILGIIQGLTEFLPVSSSGHLILVREVFKFPDPGKTFDLILHLGTFIGVLIYFRKDLLTIFLAFINGVKKKQLYGEPEINLFWFMIISTIPGGVLGFLYKDVLEEINNVYLISGLLIVFGIILLLAEKLSKNIKSMKDLSWKDSIIVGLAQAVALFPGVSRSGSSMTAALFLGFNREASARYSFLISIPIIGGASLYGLVKIIKTGVEDGELGIYVIGFLVSAITGFLCIKYLLDYLKKGSFTGFVVYRVILGVLLIGLGLAGILH